MKIEINQTLLTAYKSANKNPNYSLNFILNTLDPSVVKDGIDLPNSLSFQGNSITFDIDSNNAKIVQQIFGRTDADLIERLLWIAYLMPEM